MAAAAPIAVCVDDYRNNVKVRCGPRWDKTQENLFLIFGPFGFAVNVNGTDRRFIVAQFVASMYCGTGQATFILLAFVLCVTKERTAPMCDDDDLEGALVASLSRCMHGRCRALQHHRACHGLQRRPHPEGRPS